uniref:A disintegrin and metalloproteinase with thrombospondin motifs adt-2-like n=1 Tax=Dermatophagoides pteronyssinus TaxID=6956 RepID=A0A6P6YKR6_DERPT|nr:A disintegrin and metalloproteinase with thrombospondin motifs adt-2-like [Dermatophagoides pteronyssinus]
MQIININIILITFILICITIIINGNFIIDKRQHIIRNRRQSIRIDIVDIDDDDDDENDSEGGNIDVDDDDDNNNDIEYEGKSKLNHSNHFGNIYINLFLFYDQQLFRRFGHNKQRLFNFIYSITNSVSLSYNNLPMKHLARFYFTILDIQLISQTIRIDSDADGEQYRQSFRQYYYRNQTFQQQIYSAAILLTGYNFRFRRNKTDTQGLATVGHVACKRPHESFILVEARSYRTAFIMAHEIGHVLNMYHDEELQETSCNMNFIMSATTGPGKTQFSICSYYQLKEYFNVMDPTTEHCFRLKTDKFLARFPCDHSTSDDCKIDSQTLTVNVDEQCRMSLGETFRANILNTKLISICTKIQCTNNLVNIYIDPAIENTTCAPNKYCRAGNCL